MNRALHFLALLLSLAGSGPRLAAQQAEPVLVELQLGRLTSRTVEAFRDEDAALIPVGAFFDLAEIRVSRRTDGTMEALVQPGNVPFVLDPASSSLQLGKDHFALSPDQLKATPADIYLDTRVLGRAFGLAGLAVNRALTRVPACGAAATARVHAQLPAWQLEHAGIRRLAAGPGTPPGRRDDL